MVPYLRPEIKHLPEIRKQISSLFLKVVFFCIAFLHHMLDFCSKVLLAEIVGLITDDKGEKASFIGATVIALQSFIRNSVRDFYKGRWPLQHPWFKSRWSVYDHSTVRWV